jgi:hypothetical protein
MNELNQYGEPMASPVVSFVNFVRILPGHCDTCILNEDFSPSSQNPSQALAYDANPPAQNHFAGFAVLFGFASNLINSRRAH